MIKKMFLIGFLMMGCGSVVTVYDCSTEEAKHNFSKCERVVNIKYYDFVGPLEATAKCSKFVSERMNNNSNLICKY